MAQYSDLYPGIRGDVPMAPDFSIKRAIQHTATEFFRRTGGWEELVDPIILIEDEDRYDLDGPQQNTRTERILKVSYKNESQQPLSHARERDIIGRQHGRTGDPTHYAHTQRQELLVYPTPDANTDEKELEMLVMAIPKRDATEIPDDLMERWRDALVYGAKSRLMESRRQPWSDAEGAMYFHQLYMRELKEAKREALTGNHANLKVQSQPFGGRRRAYRNENNDVVS